ncbi:MAG: hypothetical protein EOP04_25710 [Proteobacteria bacterium]|nr:MAG: hypothetical protein EOP04_25710 [Pseudomonadota bacterium]
MNVSQKFRLSVLVLSAMAATAGFSVHAEETTGEKIENKASEVKKDAKVAGRNAKKKVRNATCTDERKAAGKCGMKKDLQDSAANAGDEISHGAESLKKKVD